MVGRYGLFMAELREFFNATQLDDKLRHALADIKVHHYDEPIYYHH